MPENNQILSVEGQLIGMPTAGPESFSQQQLDYLKRALGVDETVLWEDTATNADTVLSETANNFERIRIYYNNDGAIHNSVEVLVSGSSQNIALMAGTVYSSSQYFKYAACTLDGTSLKKSSTNSGAFYKANSGAGNAQATYETFNITWYKVVGIHRISGGN